MEIEQKERERIEATYTELRFKRSRDPYSSAEDAKEGALAEHMHLQKEVIQPLREQLRLCNIDQLNSEAENKALREAARDMLEYMRYQRDVRLQDYNEITEIFEKHNVYELTKGTNY